MSFVPLVPHCVCYNVGNAWWIDRLGASPVCYGWGFVVTMLSLSCLQQRRECGDITNDLSRDQLGFDRIFREPSLFPLSVVTRGFTTPLVMRKRSTAADMRNPTALAKRFLDSTDVCEPSIQSKARCFGLPGPGESFPRHARLCIDEKQLELKSSMELTQQVIRTRRRLTSEDPLRKTFPESQQTLAEAIPALAEKRVRSPEFLNVHRSAEGSTANGTRTRTLRLERAAC